MQITRIEFVLLVAVFSGVIIFCPDALVLLRNLCIWCLIIWAAWYGYDEWESSARVRQVLQSLVQARSLADLATLLWGESTSAGMEWVNNKALYARDVCSRVWRDFYSRCTHILGLTRSKSSLMPLEL
jgi:adenosyl cobinamide kinase/adenosyl cobinamide phosphate guanylyltransferase